MTQVSWYHPDALVKASGSHPDASHQLSGSHPDASRSHPLSSPNRNQPTNGDPHDHDDRKEPRMIDIEPDVPPRRKDRGECPSCGRDAPHCASLEWLRAIRCCQQCTGDHDFDVLARDLGRAHGGGSDGCERCQLCHSPAVERDGRVTVPHLSWCRRGRLVAAVAGNEGPQGDVDGDDGADSLGSPVVRDPVPSRLFFGTDEGRRSR